MTRTYVMAAFLANSVELRNGLFSVLSGGWATYPCNTLPAEYSWPLVIRMSLGGVRPGGSLKIQFVLLAPEGEKIDLQSIDVPRDNLASSPTWNGFVLLQPKITAAGLWTICIRTEEEELSRIPIEILLVA